MKSGLRFNEVVGVFALACIALCPQYSFAQGPTVEISGGGCFLPNDTMSVKISTEPGSGNNKADVYWAMSTPSGELYSFGQWDKPNSLEPILRSWEVISINDAEINVPLFSLPIASSGLYTFYLGMTEPGTMNVSSNLALTTFYAEGAQSGKAGFEGGKEAAFPSSCLCPTNNWTLAMNTQYFGIVDRAEVVIAMEGTIFFQTVGDSFAGAVTGNGFLTYRNELYADDCDTLTSAQWPTLINGAYQAMQATLIMDITPTAVTGTLSCGGGAIPFPPFTPPVPTGANQTLILPLVPGYSVCSPVRIPGIDGFSCMTLNCS